MQSTIPKTHSNLRTFTACLLSFMILVAPLASAAATMRRDVQPVVSKKEKISPDPAPAQPSTIATLNNTATAQPLAPLLPSITATLVDSYPVHPSTKANPGDTISYQAIVTNSGLNSPADDAANVQFNGPLDPNTTYVPGSLHASPIAFNDTYEWVGNTTLDSSARSLPSVTANDIAITDTFTLTTIAGGATSQGGSVTLNSNGHFVYTPQAGDTGADTFSYTITNNADGTLVGTGTVTINLTGRVWYVQNAPTNGDGTSSSPFNSPASASAAATLPGDIIYVLSDLPNPKLNGNFALDTGQQLLGQGIALVVNSVTLFNAGTAPTITNTAGNAVTLNSAAGTNTVRGLIIDVTSGSKIFGNNFGTLTLGNNTTPDVALSGGGQALNLTTGAFSTTSGLISVATTSSTGAGVSLISVTGGPINFGSTTVSGSTTQGILVSGSTVSVNFGNTTIAGGTDGVSLQNNSSGTRTFGTLSITNPTIIGFLHATAGGTTTVGQTIITNPGTAGIDIQDSTTAVTFGNTSITQSGGTGVELGGTSDGNSGAVSFLDLDISPDAGARAFHAVDNTGTITTTSGTIGNTGAAATTITIDGPVAQTPLAIVLDSITSDGAGNGVVIQDVSGSFATVSTNLQNNAGIGLLVSASTANFNFGNTTVNSSAGDAVDLANITGTITFGALNLTPDINVRGLDALTTGTITATSGTISTTDGVAVNISGAPLSMTLTSVTANNDGTANPGASLTNVTGSITMQGGALTGGTSAAFLVNGQNASITYAGTITQNNVARVIDVQNKTGGTVNFSGAVSGGTSSTGVLLNSNASTTFNFTGGLAVSTTTAGNSAFAATSSGTLNICDESICNPSATGGLVNTLSSTLATALNVTSTTIGANRLEFRSISAGQAASGPTNGIILNTTGAAGGLTVNGTGSAGSGGTIQRTVQGALFTSTNSLVLKYMNFTNANSGDGTLNNIDGPTFNSGAQAAINMSNVSTASFDTLQLTNPAGTGEQVGINGQTVSNLTITGTTITAFGDEVFEGAVRMFNLTGTCSITNSTFSFSEDHNVDIRNNTGTLNLTIQGNPLGTNFTQFSDTQTKVNGQNGLIVTTVSSATMNLVVKSSKFLRLKTAGISGFARDSSTLNVDVTGSGVNANGNTFDPEGGIGRAIDLNGEDTATVNFNINNNPRIWSNAGPGITIFGTGNANFSGRINNNPDMRQGGINTPGSAVYLHPEDDSDGRFEVIGNTISSLGNDTGILVLNHGDGIGSPTDAVPVENGRIDATIRQNNITLTDQFVTGIETRAGTNDGDDNDVCANIGTTTAGTGNTVNLGPFAVDNFAYLARVGNNDGARLYLEGFTTNVVTTWNNRQNTPAGSVFELHAPGATPPLAPPGGVCLTPTNPVALSLPTINQPVPNYAGNLDPTPGVGTILDFSTAVASISSESVILSSEVSAFIEKPASAIKVNTKRSETRSHHATIRRAPAADTTLAKVDTKRSETRSHHAAIGRAPTANTTVAAGSSAIAMAPLAGENVFLGFAAGGLTPGTLPAGKTVTIKYQATISTTPNAASVSTQGTISGTNFSSVLTDDPSTGAANDPTVTPIALPDLTIDKSHPGNFQQGQTGATYTITPSNSGEFSTFGTITVTDTLPTGLTPTAPTTTHNGWNCGIAGQTLTCTRSDSYAVGSLPTITLTVDVAGNAPASVTNTASVSGGGQQNTANDSDDDLTNIDTAPDLTIDKSHTGDFTQGQVGAQYSIVVTNNGPGAVLAGSTVTVTDTLPAGMTATDFSGTGWTCLALPTLSCSRSDALASTISYDPIILTVTVAGNASTPLVNSATVSGGGDNTAGNNTDNDSTNVLTSGAQGIDDQYFTPKDTQLIVPAPGVLANDTGTPAPTAVAIVGGATTQSGTVTLNTDGSFTYNPPAGFTGSDSFTYTATNSNGSDTGTVTITVSDAIYLNEVLYDPTGTDAPNEYLEFRGVPNSTIPAGTYFVGIEGDTPDNPGDVQTIINLSGLTFGSNGFLVLLQMSNTYVPQAGANVVTSTTVGFSGLPGAPFQADAAATDIEHDSVTFMLIQSATAPTLTNDIDANDDATPDGSVYAGWNVLDSIAGLDGSAATDSGYGALTFGSGQTSGTAAVVSFVPIYVGRIGDSTGSTTADWAATGALGGSAPNWTLGTNPEPPGFANKPLNHIGASNFVNLAPVNSVPGAQNVNEESTLTFNAANTNLISISDPDAATDDVKVTLTATNGTFSLSGIGGLVFTTGDGTNDTQMIFTGPITSINTALNGLTFTPTLNFFSPPDATLTILTDDQGNNGDGGAKTDSDSINITVNAVNDPPSFTLGGNPAAVNEDAGAQTVNNFATGMSSGPGESQTLTFNVTPNGTTGNIAFSSAPAIDSTTGNLTYTTSANTNGTATFDVTLSDNGGGANTSGIQSFTITVNAVNDAPSFQIPSNPPAVSEDAGAQTVNTFATSFAPGPLTATDETGQTLVGYTVTQTGTTGNLAFTNGPSIDNAGTLTYTPTANTSGTATYNVVATDSGSGTAPNVNQSAPVSFTITVNGDNDAPSLDNTGNMSLTAINEDVASGSNTGTLIGDIITSAGGDRITDLDAGALEGIAVTAVNNTNGTWEFSINNGGVWTAFGSPTPSTARLLAANATTRVRFLPNANFNGTVNPGITFQAWDQTSGTNGGTGDASVNGGTTAFSTASETASITVNPVNDQPTANAQAVVTDEDTPLGITLTGSDVETASGSLSFTVTVQPTGGVLSGTAPNLTYTPNAGFNGSDSFKFTVTDTGDGSSPALTSAEATVSITVNSVNDAPVNTMPAPQTTAENTPITFSTGNSNAISIADVDAGSNEVQVTLTASNGTMTLSGTTGLTFSPAGPNNDGTADSILTFNGTITDINAALNGMVYTPSTGFTGGTSIQIFTNDLGNSGSGGVKTDNDVLNITVNEGGSIQFSAATYNVNENGGQATITITRTGGSAGAASVLFQTSNGTADGSDYSTVSQTINFANGDTSETVNVPITNDPDNEPTQTVNLTLSNVGGSGALGSPSTAILNINNDDAVVFNFSQAAYIVGEDGLHIDITVNRGGDAAAAVSVDYETSDLSGLNACSVVNGNASDRCDYLPALGTLNFAAAQTSATFRVFVTDDVRLEGPELLTLTLSNPVGGALGAQATSSLTLTDHVAAVGGPNPIDNNAFFIRTLYLDFLSREPDPVGFQAWLDTLNNCPSFNDPSCDKVHVAQSFFHSAEFGERGYFIYRFFDAGLGQRPTYKQFLRGMQQIGSNLSPAQSEAAKMEFINDFMASAEFQAIYAGLLTPAQANAFISQLETTSGTTIPEPLRSQLVNDMATSAKTPAETLRAFMESPAIFNAFYNRGFVSMLYFGYLHRDPDTVGFNNWLAQLNSDNNFRSLTFGFIHSDEYRGRFGG